MIPYDCSGLILNWCTMGVFKDAKRDAARLILADSRTFSGISIGATGRAVGEVVFNTSMTGYQEILSDPSYAEQIICFTYPHIGNVGANSADMEANKVWAKAAIISDSDIITSNYRSEQSLDAFMQQHGMVGITGVDTRALTRHLRQTGAQMACVVSGIDIDVAAIFTELEQHPGLQGANLANVVSVSDPYVWTSPSWERETCASNGKKVVVIDFGVKQAILRLLVDRGCEVQVLPATSSVAEIMQHKPDGILLSNGPGDPAACTEIQQTITQLIQQDVPIFGICLGFQLLALCLGAQTVKMKFGHHGANHPVQDIKSGKVMITSQNHGFMVDPDSVPQDLSITHYSLFDNSIQGLKHNKLPIFGFQGHPEASPGPQDIESLFDAFMQVMTNVNVTMDKQK